MPGAQGPKTVKGAQSDANYVSRLLFDCVANVCRGPKNYSYATAGAQLKKSCARTERGWCEIHPTRARGTRRKNSIFGQSREFKGVLFSDRDGHRCCRQAASQVSHTATDGGAATSAIHCWTPSIRCAWPHGLELLAGRPPRSAGL